MESLQASIQERAKHKREYDRRMNDRMMQSKEENVDSSKALDAGLVVMESNETESERHVSSSRSEKDTYAEDAYINSVNDKQPMAETYKDLYDSIKKTRVQTKDHDDSLIAQINSKTVENADLKARIQEKVIANVALKNELTKLKGNSVDTKFAKPSILGKPVLQPPKNQSVVRQPNAFKSERPNFSKPRESMLAKPHHVIAPGSSRNSKEESYGSNDMAHNHYLEEARKKTQERNRNSKSSVMHTTSLQNTTNGSKPKPRSNNQTSRSLPVSKSSGVMSNSVPLVDHLRNSSSFSDSKYFVCSTC
ncbi:hypothetical protein Tco_0960197 [Tanacetum coccineum]